MSLSNEQAARAALETAVLAVTPTVLTAMENAKFVPPGADTLYQVCTIKNAKPIDLELSGPIIEMSGVLYVVVKAPLYTGSAAAFARAQLIKAAFPRKASFTNSGVTVFVKDTPEVVTQEPDGVMFSVVVKVVWYAHVV